ncbi:MAG: hypothetical protein MJ180_02275 [Candidatus Gastranaerophilales bacterium]|nr:hypothetical protein [Candidatus Gastranaerophilales bacterium]
MPIDKIVFSDFKVKNGLSAQNIPATKPLENQESEKNKIGRRNLLLGSLALLGVITFAGVYMYKNGKKVNLTSPKTPENIPAKEVKKVLPDVSESLNFDVEYKSKLIKGLEEIFGIKKELKDVQSIMGKEELKEILSTYPPESFSYHAGSFDFMSKIQIKRGIKNDYNKNLIDGDVFYKLDYDNYLKYIKKHLPDDLREEYYKPLIDGKFRVCLTGTIDHTILDPKVAAETLLNQAVQYADKVATKVNDGKPPFILGIQDTFEVEREVVKLLAENPEKYKNLKVILKSENGNSFFINPLDKNLVEEEKLADKEYHEGLKEIFKHFYVLPENEKINRLHSSLYICADGNTGVDRYDCSKFRFFNDNDWEKVINNPNRKRSRNSAKNTEGIFESFMDLYIRPHYNDKLKAKQYLHKNEETFLYNFLSMTIGCNEYEALPPNLLRRFIRVPSSHKKLFNQLDWKKSEKAFEDAVEVYDPFGRAGCSTTGRTILKLQEDFEIISRFPSQKSLADLFMHNEQLHTQKGTGNPVVELSIIKTDRIDRTGDFFKDMLQKIYYKDSEKIRFSNEMCKRTIETPAKYIFGDEIYITDSLWQKIIS